MGFFIAFILGSIGFCLAWVFLWLFVGAVIASCIGALYRNVFG